MVPVANAWAHPQELTETELNSVTDNPIIFLRPIPSAGGNFHGQPLALPWIIAVLLRPKWKYRIVVAASPSKEMGITHAAGEECGTLSEWIMIPGIPPQRW